MSKHTPGPWAVNTAGTGDSKGRIVIDEIYVYAPDSGADDVAIAADIADPLTGQPSEANARLIALAPTLLAALRELQANPNDPRAHRTALDLFAKVAA